MIFKNLSLNSYWKNSFSVFQGVLIAQMIPIFGSLVIAKFYTPESFGIFSTWVGFVSILSIALTLRFELVLPIIQNQKERNLAFNQTNWIVILTSALAFLVLSIDFFTGLFINKFSNFFYITLIVAASIQALIIVFQVKLAADERFNLLTKSRIANSISVVGSQLLFFWMKSGENGLIYGFLLGMLLSYSYLIYSVKDKIFGYYEKNEIVKFVKEYKKFPIFSFPGDLLSTFGVSLPLFIVNNKYGAYEAGLLGLSMKILGAPLGLVGSAILDVFKTKASRDYLELGSCRKVYLETLGVLSFVVFLFWFAGYYLIEDLFNILFGDKWSGAGQITLLLLPLYGVKLIASPLSYVFYIADKLLANMIWQIALVLTIYLSLNSSLEFISSIKSFTISVFALYLVCLILSYMFTINKKFKGIVRNE